MNVDNLVDDYLQLAKARSVPSRSAIFHLNVLITILGQYYTNKMKRTMFLLYANWQKMKKRNLNRNHWSHFCFVSATKPGPCLYTDGWAKLVTQVVSWSRSTSWTLTIVFVMQPPNDPSYPSTPRISIRSLLPPKNYPIFWVSSGISPSKSRVAAQDQGAGKIEEMTRMRIVHRDWRCTFLLCLHDIDNHM